MATQGMVSEAIAPPTLDPLSKIATATPRSFAGNHSATVLLAPGQLQPSPIPNRNLNAPNEATEFAKPVTMLMTDHQMTASASPRRVPMTSSRTPPINHIPAYEI